MEHSLGVQTWKAMLVSFSFISDHVHSLGPTRECRDDVLVSLMAITPQLLKGVIHSLLGGSDGIDYGHESFHNANVVMDDLGRAKVVLSSWWYRKHC